MGFSTGCNRNEQGTMKQLLTFAEQRPMSVAIFQGVFLFVNEGDLHMILPTGVSTAQPVLTASSL